MTDLDEVLKDRLNTLKSERDQANTVLDRARPHAGSPIQIDPALIEQFGRTMRENFSTGSAPFRKAYLQSIIDVIGVDDAQIRINGSNDVLERAVLAGGTGSVGGSQMSTRWRARRDSNSWPPDSLSDALKAQTYLATYMQPARGLASHAASKWMKYKTYSI